MNRNIAFVIIASFIALIMVGTLLLRLPAATYSGEISLENAMFTATSAVTVTGLIVHDTPVYFTPFGLTVILILIQLGGLGFMTFSTLIILLLGRSISITDQFLIASDFTTGRIYNARLVIKRVILYTFWIEFSGAVILFLEFHHLPLKKRLFSAVFHSVSAFCNAGFSTFSNSLMDFAHRPLINLTFIFLIISGGIGFIVLSDINGIIRRKIRSLTRISLHTKVVLITSFTLIIAGFLIIWLEEIFNPASPLSGSTRFWSALFQSVTARTAGFNTIDLNVLSPASLMLIALLMFVGASPGSTGGGVKTTSAGMVIAYFASHIKGREKVSLFYRNVASNNIERAFIVIILSCVIIFLNFLLLLNFEPGRNFIDLFFEIVSAFGTVGLSLGITPTLSLKSKIVIMLTMFVGRTGPLTILIALSRRKSRGVFNYPEESIMIG